MQESKKMTNFGGILIAISSITMIFGMRIVEYHNSQAFYRHFVHGASYAHMNEQLSNWIIYGGGGVVLIFGLFCIALDVALEKKI